MFRTDSSLKGVARRESNRPGINRNIVNSTKAATSSSNRADGGRDDMLEKAKVEREEREWKRKVRIFVVRIQSKWRQYRSTCVWFDQEIGILNGKLNDVEKISIAFAGVGMPFTPPAATAQALMLPFTVLWACQTKKQRETKLLFGPMKQMLVLVLLPCLQSNDPKLNFLSKVSLSLENINSTIPASLQLRIRRMVLSCLEVASFEVVSCCGSHSPFSAGPLLVDNALTLVETVSKFPDVSTNDDKGCIVAPAVLVSAVQILRVHLIIQGGLRNLFLALPEPKLSGGQSTEKVKLGGCCLSGKTALQDRIQSVLSRMWRLSVTAIECAPPAPRPSPLVIESFARNILSVPLLLWREEGKDLGRLVAASNSEDAVAVLTRPTLLFPLMKAISHLDHAEFDSPDEETSGFLWVLGNLIALGKRSCLLYGPSSGTSSNGNSWSSPSDSSVWCDLISGLLESAPLGLLSDTAPVSWHTVGSVHTPIMIPKPLLIQVRGLLEGRSSAFLDMLASTHLVGLDQVMLKFDIVTAEDEMEEKAMKSSNGAAITPAAAAQVESRRRKNTGWLDSTWAHRLALKAQKGAQMIGDTLLSMTSGGAEEGQVRSGGPSGGPSGGLVDTSHTSRAAAVGDFSGRGGVASAVAASASYSNHQLEVTTDSTVSSLSASSKEKVDVSVEAVRSYARLLTVLLRRWLNSSQGHGHVSSTPLVFWMLNTLALSSVVSGRPRLLRLLWAYLQMRRDSSTKIGLFSSAAGSSSNHEKYTLPVGDGDVVVVSLLCAILSQLLVVVDDSELYGGGMNNEQQSTTLPLIQLRRMVKYLKPLLYQRIWESSQSTLKNKEENFLNVCCGKALRDLYDRSSRRPFISQQAWLVSAAESGRVLAEVQGSTPRANRLLQSMPYALLFVERLKLFKQFVDTDKASTQLSGTPGVRVRIHRTRVLEDGLRSLNGLGSDMKKKLMVQFINSQGVEEAGMDAGGLFKEFWTDLSALAFNMDFGLFRTTSTDGTLYPNPSAEALQGSDYLELFAFLGRILGKALYEGLTVEPKFAHFFLAYMRGNYNYLNTWHDLQTLDAEYYKNLMFLKTYKGDVADLCLTFTVAADATFGDGQEVELISGGSKLDVTNRNKLEYVERVANYLLVKRLRPASEAFRRGLAEIIDPSWLSMFNEPELQVLISGAETAIDVEDLKAHCRYQGFVPGDRVVARFWKVVGSLTAAEQALLLRFVTSCQRPPPLGFEQLNPRFCLQRISISSDNEKLPSASTCFNTLKLPTYSSEKVMKQKLLLSITSNSGFELT